LGIEGDVQGRQLRGQDSAEFATKGHHRRSLFQRGTISERRQHDHQLGQLGN
jgi:hypothetical protein